jgi:hypothetical protein
MKIVIRLILVTLIFVLACKGSNQEKKKISDNSNPPNIEVFSDIPSDIDGCTCMFSFDSTNYNAKKYIYMNDFAQTAYMKLNGQMNKFTLSTKSEIDNKASKIVYLNDSYEVEIEIQDKKNGGYESTITIGIITVKNKVGQKSRKAFYGICGC